MPITSIHLSHAKLQVLLCLAVGVGLFIPAWGLKSQLWGGGGRQVSWESALAPAQQPSLQPPFLGAGNLWTALGKHTLGRQNSTA